MKVFVKLGYPTWKLGLAVPVELPPEVRERWLPDQPIVYIGKAGGPNFKSTLRKRVRQFYGDRSPHRGGKALGRGFEG